MELDGPLGELHFCKKKLGQLNLAPKATFLKVRFLLAATHHYHNVFWIYVATLLLHELYGDATTVQNSL